MLNNFCPRKHAKVRVWTADRQVLVSSPTYDSWPNWVEAILQR
ncbi:hypothetical protein AB0D57_24800 [Streptomyces sp. NPDC048275]